MGSSPERSPRWRGSPSLGCRGWDPFHKLPRPTKPLTGLLIHDRSGANGLSGTKKTGSDTDLEAGLRVRSGICGEKKEGSGDKF